MRKHSIICALHLSMCLATVLFFVFSFMVKAEEPVEVPETDTHNLVDITVELEDSSRFMGISVYQIGEYRDGDFAYISPYKDLVQYDYYTLQKDSTKESHVLKFCDYIEENSLEGDYQINVINGTGAITGLEPGLYLLEQNMQTDYNSQLQKAFLIEGPTYQAATKEYLFDIRSYPSWEKTIWFSFRPEVVNPMSLTILLLACVLLCFYGARIIKPAMFLIPFAAIGTLGLRLAERAKVSFLWMMFMYVMFAFMGAGLTYLLFSAIMGLLKNTKLSRGIKRQSFWITPLVGAAIGAYLVYRYLSQNAIFYLYIPIAVFILGVVWQFFTRKRIPIFHTYDELIRSKPINEEA